MDITSAYLESAITGQPCSYASHGLMITVHPNGRIVAEHEASAGQRDHGAGDGTARIADTTAPAVVPDSLHAA